MQKKLLVVIVLLGAFVVAVVMYRIVSRSKAPTNATDIPHGSGAERAPETRNRDYSIAQAPKLLPEEVGERYLVPEIDSVEELKGDKIGYYFMYDTKRRIMEKYSPHAPKDTPKIELRFRKPDADGQMIPCLVSCISFSRVDDGVIAWTMRDRELGVVGFHRPEWGFKGAYGVRLLLFEPPVNITAEGLFFGQTYRLGIGYVPGDNYEQRDVTEKLITVPKTVPRGKMAVMEIDVTKGYTEELTHAPLPTGSRATIRISRALMEKDDLRVLHTSSDDPPGYASGLIKARVVKDRRVYASTGILGHELGLVQMKGTGSPSPDHLICYIPEVQETDISLPEDAELWCKDEDFVDFRLRVPWDRISNNALLLALFMNRESKVWVTQAALKNRPATVKLRFVPGIYVVRCFEPKPKEDRLRMPSISSSVIGKVTIKKSDAGKTLEVEPLEE